MSVAPTGALFLSGSRSGWAYLAEFDSNVERQGVVFQPDAVGGGVAHAPDPYFALGYEGSIVFDGGTFRRPERSRRRRLRDARDVAARRLRPPHRRRSFARFSPPRAGRSSGTYVVGSWSNRLEMLGERFTNAGTHIFAAKVFTGVGEDRVVVDIGDGGQVARAAASDGACHLYVAGRVTGGLPGSVSPDGAPSTPIPMRS